MYVHMNRTKFESCTKQYRISPVELRAKLEKFDHITPWLKDLRWLPVKQQLYYRLAVLVFKNLRAI